MSLDDILIALVILPPTLLVIVLLVALRRQQAKDDELQRAAAARGWTYENTSSRRYLIRCWTGTTDGVAWQAESLVQKSGDTPARRRRIARWHGAWNPGVSSPVVVVGLPKGKEDLVTTIPEGDGFFGRLTQKAFSYAFDKTIDGYFGDGPGKEVDAATMRPVAVKVPGFVVMANDTQEGARIMQQGLDRVLRAAASDQSLTLPDGHRPWILLRPHAVSVTRIGRVRDMNDLERFVRAGISLTRNFTFGRPGTR